METLSDTHLLRAFCGGDQAAFDALFRRYSGRVYATAWRLTRNRDDAEDVLQEAFIALARHAASIRRGEALGRWLYRAAVNRAMDLLRRRRALVSLDADSARSAQVIAVASLRRESENQHARLREGLLCRVEALIPRLPERQGAAFVLRFFQGLPHSEIGAILGIAETTAKSQHCHAVRKLREWIAAEDAAHAAGAAGGAAATPRGAAGGGER